MQPFNYTINTGGANEAFQQGMNQTAGLMATAADFQKSQAMIVAAQQKAEADAYKRQRFQSVSQNPNSKDVQSLLLEFPELHEGLGKSLDFMSADEKKNTQAMAFSVLSALENGKDDAAVQVIDQQIDAAKNANDTASAKRLEVLRNSVIANPNAARFSLDGLLFSTMGKDYGDLRKNLGEDKRAQELQPMVADKAKSDAEKARFDVKKTSAEAVIKEVEAKFAPQNIMAELGLKRAQTNQANAAAGASSASAAASRATANRANAEAGQMRQGIIPAEKRPEAEGKFREEYAKRTAVYQDVKASYGRVLSSNNDAAGDLSLIFGYMKMLDPGSVVREGEFANAQNAAGVPERIQNIYNKAARGERLTDGQRKMFKGQAKSLYDVAAKQENEIRTGISRIASGYGLNNDNIFYTGKEAAPVEPSPGSQSAAPSSKNIDALLKKYGQ
jgi:hypothetical protein